jgi:uncharacterized membrane protein YeiH
MALAVKPVRLDGLVQGADLAGTAVFAAEGALAGMAGKLDLLGVLVIAFVNAVGGGLVRDVLLGATPPAALRDQRYMLIIIIAAAATIACAAWLGPRGHDALLTLDAAGLALFAVAGTEKALAFGPPTLTAILLGTIGATGGG